MSIQSAALELLKALSAVVERWGRWYLFRAQAAVAYGVPRFSADIDVTLALAPDAPERFVRDMEAGGFALGVDDPEFVRKTRVLPFVHAATGMPLDVVLVCRSGSFLAPRRAKMGDFVEAAGRRRYKNIAHGTLAGSGLEEEFLGRAKTTDVVLVPPSSAGTHVTG